MCRVIYLCGQYDPPSVIANQTNLTPNSINIHGKYFFDKRILLKLLSIYSINILGRTMNLGPEISISGFSEGEHSLLEPDSSKQPEITEEDELDKDFEVKQSQSIDIIHEIISE